MKDLVLRHGEKIVVIFVIVLCAYWISTDLQSYRTESGKGGEVDRKIKIIRDYIDTHQAKSVAIVGYDRKLAETVNVASGQQLAAIPPRIFFPQVKKGEQIPIDMAFGKLAVPADVKSTAERGQVEVKWVLNGTSRMFDDVGFVVPAVNVCKPVEFHVYRWDEQVDAVVPDKPYKVIPADWPERRTEGDTPASPAAALMTNPTGMGAGAFAGAAAEGEDGVKKAYSFTDNQVEPMTTYSYRVRVKARVYTKDEWFGPGKKGMILTPDNITQVVEDGTQFWMSGLSVIASATTPTNIMIFYKGSTGQGQAKQAQINVMRWNGKESAWGKGKAIVAERQKIVGVRRLPGIGVGTEEIDSGYELVEIVEEERTRKEEVIEWELGPDGKPVKTTVVRERKYLFQGVKVKEVTTGKIDELEIFRGKEENVLSSPAGSPVGATTPPAGRGDSGGGEELIRGIR
ncbi:MAG: hypothetical protein JW909_03875 [Planctomycetes bacterium]|nr:hypothetical protein [Planctomycetota bacterium]